MDTIWLAVMMWLRSLSVTGKKCNTEYLLNILLLYLAILSVKLYLICSGTEQWQFLLYLPNYCHNQCLLCLCESLRMWRPGLIFNIKTIFLGIIGIPIIKMRWSWDRVIFIMRIPVLIRWYFYSEMTLTAPSHYLNRCWLIISKVHWHS